MYINKFYEIFSTAGLPPPGPGEQSGPAAAPAAPPREPHSAGRGGSRRPAPAPRPRAGTAALRGRRRGRRAGGTFLAPAPRGGRPRVTAARPALGAGRGERGGSEAAGTMWGGSGGVRVLTRALGRRRAAAALPGAAGGEQAQGAGGRAPGSSRRGVRGRRRLAGPRRSPRLRWPNGCRGPGLLASRPQRTSRRLRPAGCLWQPLAVCPWPRRPAWARRPGPAGTRRPRRERLVRRRCARAGARPRFSAAEPGACAAACSGLRRPPAPRSCAQSCC